MALATSILNPNGKSSALLAIKRIVEAATSASGSVRSNPFETRIASAGIQSVNSGISQITHGDRRFFDVLYANVIALIGKTNTNPSKRLPIK